MHLPLNHWYPVLEPREVGRRPLGVERLGVRLVFWRDGAGRLHAHDERCPHMGAALGRGSVIADRIVCPFHGFQFDANGRCAHAPALGAAARAPATLVLRGYPVLEKHGFVWLWWGDERPGERVPAFFGELETGWTHGTSVVDWPVHYTRAIENQLDVAHLPFVHRSTIGAGGRDLVEGPHVESDASGIRVWTTNRRDDGAPVRGAAQLAAAASKRKPSLHLLFPGVWLLNISERFKNFIAFVPVNDRCTRYYLRSYLRGHNPLLATPVHWLLAWSNRFILNQDRRVVVTQPAGSSLEGSGDHLLATDRAIIEYRRLHRDL